ncbi:MAG: cysteine desulfurase [Bryobacteraceae bacterium]|nr:cysteine desulfurase [Bryobacteraceae bacterium]
MVVLHSAVSRFYFDHNATTPMSPEVFDAWAHAGRELYGNASSIHHAGQDARRELEYARVKVARLLGANAKEIVFCSGGTEADNTALFGILRSRERPHLITTMIEHPAVLQAAAQLEREGCEVTVLPVGSDGVVDPDDVRRALQPNTVLISVMHVNNEIGTVQPLAEIGKITRSQGILLHSDGVQAAGRIPVDVAALGVDLYSLSGHKMYAPKGVGVLYVRKGVRLDSLLFGGRHENGRRPGTENVPAAVALGAAADTALAGMHEEMTRLTAMRDHLEDRVREMIPSVRVNCCHSFRAPNTSSLSIDGIEGEAVIIALDLKGFCVSSGAACSSGSVEPSHVLTSIGLSRRDAKSCIRISLGKSNTPDQVDALVGALAGVSERLRKLSPDYVTHG